MLGMTRWTRIHAFVIAVKRSLTPPVVSEISYGNLNYAAQC